MTATTITDIHTHGIEGLDTTDADPEVIRRIAETQGRAGVSEIVLSIYPGPLQTMRCQMAAVKNAMKRQGEIAGEAALGKPGDHTEPFARILGVHLEGPFLNPRMCGALNPMFFLEPREAYLEELIEGFADIIRMVTVAPEREGSPGLIRKMADAGFAVSMGHSDATYSEAEKGFGAGARGITHLFNAMRGFHHRQPGIAGFGLLNEDVYVEIIGDLHHLNKETVGLVLRVKRRDRIILVSDSVRDTTIDRGGTPTDQGGRMVGGSMTLPAAARSLIGAGFDEEIVNAAISENPRDYLR